MSAPRIVIVDDEPPARDKLRRFIEEDGRAQIVGEAGDGLDAIRVIEETRPDIVLLDIRMPELDGFEVLAALDLEPMPHIVFVTAHDEHALRAFEVRALDYLLKPVDRSRFVDALDRALVGSRQDTRALPAELHEDRPLVRFVVRVRGRMRLVPVDDVEWFGGAGNYVELHVAGDTHLVRGTLRDIEARLPDRFARIHRSTIVNLDRVRELHGWSHGDLMVEMADGTELRLSRRFRDRLDSVFGL